jgi:hypothetical protein
MAERVAVETRKRTGNLGDAPLGTTSSDKNEADVIRKFEYSTRRPPDFYYGGTPMTVTSFKIDAYSVKIFAKDNKGLRTRWGDRSIVLFSGGKEVARAVFSRPGHDAPEPYFSEGKIHYFADSDQFSDVLYMLRHEQPVYIAWEPVYDPKEADDGDAYFYTDAGE